MKLLIVKNGFYETENSGYQIARFLEEAHLKEGWDAEVYANRMPCWELPKADAALFLDKDVHLAARLEKEMPVFNGSEGIRLADNKADTYFGLLGCVPMPETLTAPKKYHGEMPEEWGRVLCERWGGFVVKEAYSSLGAGVYLCKTAEDFKKAIPLCGTKEILFQPFVKESEGRSLRLYVVGEEVVAGARFVNGTDFRSNVAQHGKVENYTPTAEQKDAAVRAVKKLGLAFGGVDLFDLKEPMLIEVNSNAYFRGLEQNGKYNVAGAVIDYISRTVKGRI